MVAARDVAHLMPSWVYKLGLGFCLGQVALPGCLDERKIRFTVPYSRRAKTCCEGQLLLRRGPAAMPVAEGNSHGLALPLCNLIFKLLRIYFFLKLTTAE